MQNIILNCSMLLLLINSAGAMQVLRVEQRPRFYGVKVGRQVAFTCSVIDKLKGPYVMSWYKVKVFKDHTNLFKQQTPLYMNSSEVNGMGKLIIKNVDIEDSGIYFCKMNLTWGHGSELQVSRPTNKKSSEWRSSMKDMIIIFQCLLLVLCIILPLVRFFTMKKKEDSEYEEPEEDHTYEGLEIEHCQDLYEELTGYSQIQDTDAHWQVNSSEQE